MMPWLVHGLRGRGIDVVCLDALDISAAHILGISMGGMIVQLMARHYPECVASATIVMSRSSIPSLPARPPEIERPLLSQPGDPNDRDQAVE